MTSRTFVIVGSVLAFFVVASGTLAMFLLQHRVVEEHGSVTRALEPKALVSEKDQVSNYLSGALSLHTKYKSGKIDKATYKKGALALVVPAVLRQRHLQWILAMDAGREAQIEDMMQEYTALSLVK